MGGLSGYLFLPAFFLPETFLVVPFLELLFLLPFFEDDLAGLFSSEVEASAASTEAS